MISAQSCFAHCPLHGPPLPAPTYRPCLAPSSPLHDIALGVRNVVTPVTPTLLYILGKHFLLLRKTGSETLVLCIWPAEIFCLVTACFKSSLNSSAFFRLPTPPRLLLFTCLFNWLDLPGRGNMELKTLMHAGQSLENTCCLTSDGGPIPQMEPVTSFSLRCVSF